jgi:2-isopropylmalate synthase
VDAGTPVVTIVGKAHDLHVTRILETTTEENLAMIADSIRYLKSQGLVVFFDAEHFFAGFLSDRAYALQCLTTAAGAGADCGSVRTNGGTITSTVAEVVRLVVDEVDCPVGIHTHNGADVAVASSLAAVEAGATHVQAAANGYGDMCGNANMFSIIADLKLKMGLDVISEEQLSHLTETSRYVSEIANLPPSPASLRRSAAPRTRRGCTSPPRSRKAGPTSTWTRRLWGTTPASWSRSWRDGATSWRRCRSRGSTSRWRGTRRGGCWSR